MLAKDHPEIKSVAKTIYQLDNDSTIQWLCQREQDSINHVKAMRNLIAERDSALAEKDIALAERDSAIEKLLEENRRLKQQISSK